MHDQEHGFNLKREAAPVATRATLAIRSSSVTFQSQTRSRPGCHVRGGLRIAQASHGFNLKREAAPVATCPGGIRLLDALNVSISNEKPPRLPPHDPAHPLSAGHSCFNLKREAAPVATCECRKLQPV